MGDNPRSHVQQSGAPAAVGPDALPLLMMSGKRRHSLLRSEPMVMLQFIVQAESCAETVEELGMSFDYVQAKPGECVVWSKRTYPPPHGHEP